MTASSAPSEPSAKDLLVTLSRIRGTARVRLHLLNLEAQSRFRQFEARLETLDSHLDQGNENGALKLVAEVTEGLRQLLSAHPVASLHAKAGDLMRPVQACSPSDNLSHASRLMWELDCGFLPVCDRGGNLVGVITDRDVCMAAYTRGQLLGDIQVWSTMSTQVVTVPPSASLEDILTLMRRTQVRRVPVVENERLLGAVTLADVALYLDTPDTPSTVSAALNATLAAISAPRSQKVPGPA